MWLWVVQGRAQNGGGGRTFDGDPRKMGTGKDFTEVLCNRSLEDWLSFEKAGETATGALKHQEEQCYTTKKAQGVLEK